MALESDVLHHPSSENFDSMPFIRKIHSTQATRWLNKCDTPSGGIWAYAFMISSVYFGVLSLAGIPVWIVLFLRPRGVPVSGTWDLRVCIAYMRLNASTTCILGRITHALHGDLLYFWLFSVLKRWGKTDIFSFFQVGLKIKGIEFTLPLHICNDSAKGLTSDLCRPYMPPFICLSVATHHDL